MTRNLTTLSLLVLLLTACSDFTPAPKVARYDAQTNTILPPVHCTDWSHPSDYNYDNSVHSNFGCATENNLAVHIANPRDLEQGRGASGPDTETTVNVIQRYRANEIPEPLQPAQATGGGE